MLRLVLFGLLCALSTPKSAAGHRLLIIIPDQSFMVSHSNFLDSFVERGYQVHVTTKDDKNIDLQSSGTFIFDHLILFDRDSDDGFTQQTSVQSIIEFIDSGRNVMVFSGSGVGDSLRELAAECGVEFGESGSFVVDHFHSLNTSESDSSIIMASELMPEFAQPNSSVAVFYQGVGHVLLSKTNGLHLPILSAFGTSYSQQGRSRSVYSSLTALAAAPHSTPSKFIGQNIQLISGFQGRNNGRVGFVGSLSVCSNRYVEQDASTSSNSWLCGVVSEWVFQERGVLRVAESSHSLLDSLSVTCSSPPSHYHVYDWMRFKIKMEEWKREKWVPFQPSDAQLEVKLAAVMMRLPLSPLNHSLVADFQLPHRHGVYSFVVHYQRRGLSVVRSKVIIPLHPIESHRFPRFLASASPFYLAAFSTLLYFFLFCFFVLFDQQDPKESSHPIPADKKNN